MLRSTNCEDSGHYRVSVFANLATNEQPQVLISLLFSGVLRLDGLAQSTLSAKISLLLGGFYSSPSVNIDVILYVITSLIQLLHHML